MVAAIHALTATVFVALAVRNKAVASILTAAAMPANDIFLFTNATGFRHALPPLEPSSMRNSIPEPVARVNKKSITQPPGNAGVFSRLTGGWGCGIIPAPEGGIIAILSYRIIRSLRSRAAATPY